MLVDFGNSSKGIFDYLVYIPTAYGHEAVIVFFVLSGFLISRSIMQRRGESRWAWSDYIIERLSRLWTPLLPCLLLTFVLDASAIHFTHAPFYRGTEAQFHSGPLGAPIALNAATLAGNLLFLQTIFVPVFGSNGPLWSLANEAWYYVAFPILICALGSGRSGSAILLALTALVLVAGQVSGSSILTLWPAWLLGYGALITYERATRAEFQPNLGHFLTLGICSVAVLSLPLTRRVPQTITDLFLAVIVAGWVVLSTTARPPNVAGRHISRALAAPSYTLYLSHFPILAFLSATCLGNARQNLSWWSFGEMAAMFAVAISAAILLYLPFERRTPEVRKAIIAILSKQPLQK